MDEVRQKTTGISTFQNVILVMLRMAVGWHLLYEGIAKILIPGWTSAAYLENSTWLLADIFHRIAANPGMLFIVDWLNILGLTVIGLFLLLGFFTRTAGVMGMILLLLYYFAYPPFIGTDFGIPLEGHYLFVNKTLIEIFALLVITGFPSGMAFSLDRILLYRKLSGKSAKPALGGKDEEPGYVAPDPPPVNQNRREVMQYLAAAPIMGGFVYGTVRKYNWEKVNAITGASIQVSDARVKDLQGALPKGKIGKTEISRLFIGGNLIGGWAHSRDLIYVSSLFKAYNTEKKVFETLQLAEQAGINTINIHHSQFPLFNKYRRIFGSRLQTVCQIHPTKDDIYSQVDLVIDNGVDLIQIQGNCTDWRVRDGEIDVLANCIDYSKKQGYTTGLGAHAIQALMECEKAGIKPDFYMKTFHHDKYWSAHPKENRIPYSVDTKRSENHDEFHDNMFCLFPEETIAFFKNTSIPLIAFKVLAGGSIHPKDGFKFAFENGADFICVGMFDYQIIDDVNIAVETLKNIPNRERIWCA